MQGLPSYPGARPNCQPGPAIATQRLILHSLRLPLTLQPVVRISIASPLFKPNRRPGKIRGRAAVAGRTPELRREPIDRCQNFDTHQGVPVSKFFLSKRRPRSCFMIDMDTHGYPWVSKLEDRRNAVHPSRIRIGPESAIQQCNVGTSINHRRRRNQCRYKPTSH